MIQIVYTPYKKRVLFFLFLLGGVTTATILMMYNKGLVLVGAALAYFMLIAFTSLVIFRGRLEINKDGFAAVDNKKGVLAFVPWSEIEVCKTYGKKGDPIVCVCFRHPGYKIHGMYLLDWKESIPIKQWGMEVWCDHDLSRLCYGRITKNDFIEREVFGFSVSQDEYEQIHRWWSQANSASISD